MVTGTAQPALAIPVPPLNWSFLPGGLTAWRSPADVFYSGVITVTCTLRLPTGRSNERTYFTVLKYRDLKRIYGGISHVFYRADIYDLGNITTSLKIPLVPGSERTHQRDHNDWSAEAWRSR